MCEKIYLLMCPHQRLKSAYTSTQSDQSSLSALRNLDYPECAQWRFWSDCTNVQADLNLCWAYLSDGTFSDILIWLSEYLVNTVRCTPNSIYDKCPKILNAKVSDKMAFAINADPDQSDQVYTVCHSTKNVKKQLHKKQTLRQTSLK